MGKNLRNRAPSLPVWVQHMWNGQWGNYQDFASVEEAESWVRAQHEQRDRHAGSWPADGYRIRKGRRVISGSPAASMWFPPTSIEPGGWANVPGLGAVRPMLARAFAESIIQACDEIEGKRRADPTPLITKALAVAQACAPDIGTRRFAAGSYAEQLDALSYEASRYYEQLRESVGGNVVPRLASKPAAAKRCTTVLANGRPCGEVHRMYAGDPQDWCPVRGEEMEQEAKARGRRRVMR